MEKKGKDDVVAPIAQNLKKYNRESGKKTLVFIGILIGIIVILSILSLVLMSRSRVMTSSIEIEISPTSLPNQN